MARRNLIHEGDSTILYEGPEEGTLIQYFKDDGNAVPSEEGTTVAGKGVLNNRISMLLMRKLDEIGIPTHAIQPLNMREQAIYELEMLPMKVIVRNYAASGLCRRLGLDEGSKLPYPIIEFFHADKSLGAQMVNEDHVALMEWAHEEEIEEMTDTALRINDFLTGFFLGTGLRLIDFKLEFGRFWRDNFDYILVVGDVLTPDTCRLVDVVEHEKSDKPNYLRNKMSAYQDIAKRLGVLPDQPLNMPEDFESDKFEKAKKTANTTRNNVRSFRKRKN